MSVICRTCGGEVPNHRPSVLDPNRRGHPGHRVVSNDIQGKQSKNIHLFHWYHANEQILYITAYEEHFQENQTSIEGIAVKDFAAYVTFQYIGENTHPYRTVAEIEGIPMPEMRRVTISGNASIQELSKEEALKVLSNEGMR